MIPPRGSLTRYGLAGATIYVHIIHRDLFNELSSLRQEIYAKYLKLTRKRFAEFLDTPYSSLFSRETIVSIVTSVVELLEKASTDCFHVPALCERFLPLPM